MRNENPSKLRFVDYLVRGSRKCLCAKGTSPFVLYLDLFDVLYNVNQIAGTG